METCAEDFGMRFNVSKCYLMSIHRSKHPSNGHYKLDSNILEQVEENPYLGDTIHQNLRLASHINERSHKVNYLLGFVQCNQKHANRDIKVLAYTSLAKSVFE